MLIIALVLAVIGLAALVFAVVTSNEFIAYICIAASVLGVVLLIVDALRERQRRAADGATPDALDRAATEAEHGTAAPARNQSSDEDYPEDAAGEVGNASAPSPASGAGASAEPGGSDEYDHDPAGQGAAAKDNPDDPD